MTEKFSFLFLRMQIDADRIAIIKKNIQVATFGRVTDLVMRDGSLAGTERLIVNSV